VAAGKSVAGLRRVGLVRDTKALLAAFDAQPRAEPPNPPPGIRYERDGPVLRVVGADRGFISAPPDTGLRGAELDQLIARQRDYFARRGEAVEWKTYAHDQPPDLVVRLSAAGFVAEDLETVLVGPTEQVATPPVLPEGIVLRQVTADADMRRIASMESAVWGENRDHLGDHLIRELAAAPKDFAVLAAEAGGHVVAAGWISFLLGSDFAGLWGVSTLREWRRQGIYHALVAARAQLAAVRDVPYLQVDASSDSAPILRRLGFQALTTTTPYVWTPPRT
jgi:GNAT superfamily N-acetyltransferase